MTSRSYTNASLQRCIVLAAVLSCANPQAAQTHKNPPNINYMLHCQGCHRSGGIGHPGIVPRLRDSVGQFLATEQGRRYLIQVPGVAHSALDDAELAAVLNWIIEQFDPNSVKDGYKSFDAREIAAHRYRALENVAQARRRSLVRD